MLALYLKVLALTLGMTNTALLMFSFAGAAAVQVRDFVFSNAILFLTTTLIFISLDLFGPAEQRSAETSRQISARE